MGEAHTIVGFAVVALFSVGWLWGGWVFLRKRAPGDGFWSWLTAAQIVAGLQAVLGLVLLLLGRRPTTLHYVYGFGPLAVLVVGHVVARDAQREGPRARPVQPWAAFALASFVCFGLSLRALMTGLELG